MCEIISAVDCACRMLFWSLEPHETQRNPTNNLEPDLVPHVMIWQWYAAQVCEAGHVLAHRWYG